MSPQDFKEQLREAKAMFDAGRLEEARDLLEGAIPEDERDGRLLTFLAYLHYKLGDLSGARDLYLRLAGIEPDNLSVWSNLGLVTLKLGFFDEARRAFETYLALKPDDPRIRGYLETVLKKVDRSAAAAAPPPAREAARDVSRTPAEPSRQPQVNLETEGGALEPAAGSAPPAAQAAQAPGAEAPETTPHPDAVSLKEWIRLYQEEEVVSSHQYHSLSSSLVAVRLDHRVIFALPALTMYQGITVFGQGPNPYGKIPRAYRSDNIILMAAEGNGTLWLTHEAGWLVTLSLDHESLCLNAHRLVAFDDTVECEWLPLGKERFLPGLAALRLSGRGRVVLAAGGGMASTGVRPGTSHYLRPSAVVAWTDGLHAAADGGEDLKKVKGFFDSPFLRFEGMGWVFVAGGSGRS